VSRWFLAAALLTGCGRFAFDDLARDGGGDAVPLDIAVATGCAQPTAAPANIRIEGQTFRYTSFDNTSAVVAGTMVSETFATNTQGTASDNNGDYTFGIATSGKPGDFAMDVSRANNFTTHITTDLLIASDQIGDRLDPVMHLGDAPIWDQGQMTGIYASAGGAYAPGLGTLNVAVRDCAGEPVTGVTVTLTPPAAKLFYQSTDGSGTNTTATAGKFTHAIALGVPPGPVTIHATGGGKTFVDRTVLVLAGTNNTLAFVHGAD